MKLLIAYDGSRDADAAIDDLSGCGLPARGLAEVISVAEVWLPPPGAVDLGVSEESREYLEEVLHRSRDKADRAVAEAEILSKFGAGRVEAMLPEWDVTPIASSGSPGWAIVAEAEKIAADLIVVGAQGQSFLSRLVLGSISQRVLTEAPCSVRVGRGRIDLDSGPQRILIGFDGSRGAVAAVNAVAHRNWREGAEIRLVAVTEPATPTSIGRFVPPVTGAIAEIDVAERKWLELSAEAAVGTLRKSGLDTKFDIRMGSPKQVLVYEAEKWGADCIFVGANAWGSRLERFLIGSTSAAVAARAHCSVEVVRATLPPSSLQQESSRNIASDGTRSRGER
jgi:nucleotide-binding universal stress UspA family protein